MKRVVSVTKLYVCDVCGRAYETRKECTQCETSHNRVGIFDILKAEYSSNRKNVYPKAVIVAMKDRRMFRFKMDKEITG